VVKHVLFRKKG